MSRRQAWHIRAARVDYAAAAAQIRGIAWAIFAITELDDVRARRLSDELLALADSLDKFAAARDE